MGINTTTAQNMAGSQIAPKERWLKMYRKIHDLFLKKDFTNRRDFEFTLKQLNARIDQVEANVTSTLSQINAKLQALDTFAQTHTHATSPVGPPVPGVPPLVPPPPPTFLKSPPAKSTKQFVTQRNRVLQSTGEPVVPA